ncbi:MAG: cytochrome c biogenesis protein ResB [Planctomycetaceae bacterium]|nr:cytochrome c biogenesis protein ResB [Planctomycetaceae bacterium]
MNDKQVRSNVLMLSVLLMTGLTIFSIVAAFAGAQRAKVFFNSLPLTAFWWVLLILLLASLFLLPRPRKRTPSLLVHAGLALVLAGGMAGSQKGHAFFNRFRSQPLIPRGGMVLVQGQTSNTVELEDGGTFELPFAVRLRNAAADYYPDSMMPKDYTSDLEILVNGLPVKQQQIEVNKPLAYGGYSFYQNTFGFEGPHLVSGILIVSSQGVRLVFAGYAFIVVGLFWHFAPILFASKRFPEVQ